MASQENNAGAAPNNGAENPLVVNINGVLYAPVANQAAPPAAPPAPAQVAGAESPTPAPPASASPAAALPPPRAIDPQTRLLHQAIVPVRSPVLQQVAGPVVHTIYHVPQPVQQVAQPAQQPVYQAIQPVQMYTIPQRASGYDLLQPQEAAPADPDPFRLYLVREVDGSWTQRNRLTIDSGDIGACRWYIRPDGSFYAVRLPN